jgi:tetratricopeptide (TPR) repeat protein
LGWNDKAWNGKGNALEKLGKFDEARKTYDRAIKIDPHNSKSWSNKESAFRFKKTLSQTPKTPIPTPKITYESPTSTPIITSSFLVLIPLLLVPLLLLS